MTLDSEQMKVNPFIINKHVKAGIYILPAFLLLFAWNCWAGGPLFAAPEVPVPQRLTLTVGKSIVIESPAPLKRISLANPEIADTLVLSPKQVYVIGKAPGITNISIWIEEGKLSAIYDLEVIPDVSRLKERLHEVLPNEENIKVTATHEGITLSGTVSNSSNLSQALSLAQAYAPRDKDNSAKVTNLLESGGVHQVMLEVRVSEMSRSLIRRLGFNFNFISSSGSHLGLTMLNNLTRLPSEKAWPANPLTVSDNVNAIFQFLVNGASWTVFIDALKDQGLLKVLAEPTLITLSGKSADFLAGGEFPVPVPQVGGGGTTITIDYKTFGVGLKFTPTVLSNGKISMDVAPEVSELDFTNAISLQGYIVPALTTRRVSTSIELADGQSFAIAGLLRDDVREVIRKFPVLGDVPVLGALFRSSSFQKNETELIVIVTPHLVKPIDMAKQPLPTDYFVEPDDYEFYLLGQTEGKGTAGTSIDSSGVPMGSGGLEGDFGYITP